MPKSRSNDHKRSSTEVIHAVMKDRVIRGVDKMSGGKIVDTAKRKTQKDKPKSVGARFEKVVRKLEFGAVMQAVGDEKKSRKKKKAGY